MSKQIIIQYIDHTSRWMIHYSYKSIKIYLIKLRKLGKSYRLWSVWTGFRTFIISYPSIVTDMRRDLHPSCTHLQNFFWLLVPSFRYFSPLCIIKTLPFRVINSANWLKPSKWKSETKKNKNILISTIRGGDIYCIHWVVNFIEKRTKHKWAKNQNFIEW